MKLHESEVVKKTRITQNQKKEASSNAFCKIDE